jgi:hypothetical protein
MRRNSTPPCKKNWPDRKISITFTPGGRRPQTFFPPVVFLPPFLLCRSTAIAVQQPCKLKVKGKRAALSFSLFLPFLYDLSVHRCDKNVVFFIHQSNRQLTSVSSRLFDDSFRSVRPPDAVPGSNHRRFSHHFILSQHRVIKILARTEFLAGLLLYRLHGKRRLTDGYGENETIQNAAASPDR